MLAASLVLAAANAARAAAPALRCSVSPQPLLGHALAWVIRARDLPEMPMLRGDMLGPDWRLLGQQAERSASPSGSLQTLRVQLVPLRAGELRLPPLHDASRVCAARTLRVAPAAPGRPPRYLAARATTDRPVVGEAVRVQVEAASGGGVVWEAPEARSDAGLLRPLGSVSARVDAGGREIEVQRWIWSFTPLRAGDARIRFSLLRGGRFGEPRVYALPSLSLGVRGLPAYWPAQGPIGRARLRVEPAPSELTLGASGVLRARLAGVQVGRRQLSRLLAELPATPGLRVGTPRLWREPQLGGALYPRWDIELPFRVERAGALVYPGLRLLAYDPVLGAPRLATAGWGTLRVRDPRPRRVLLAVGGVGLVVLLLALSRLGGLALRAALCRARWRRLARRGDVQGLLRQWRRARARGDVDALSLRRWLGSRHCGGRALREPGLAALLAEAERRLYGT